MSAEQNKAVAHRIIEFYEDPTTALANELFAPDLIGHVPGLGELRGPEEARRYIGDVLRGAFPDLQLTFHDLIAEGDLTAIRWTITGTHRGEFQGIAPTGREVTWSGMSFDRYVDGKLVEGWAEIDTLGLLRQLGAIPNPDQAASQ